MMRAVTAGICVMTGILIGRVQIIENHDANDAVAANEQLTQRFVAVQREAVRTRVLLDKTEVQLVDMWRRLEPMLEDFTQAETLLERDGARRRIKALRWEMGSVDAVITAAREASGNSPRTAMRQVFVKGFRD